MLNARPVAALLLTALLAVACSTPVDPAVMQKAAQAGPAVDDGPNRIITGSRIPRKSTDRHVKTTDAAGAREMKRDEPPSLGPRSN